MKKKLLVVIIILLVVLVSIYMFISKSDTFTNKTISYNGNNLLISIDGNNSNTLPTTGNYYLTKYKCSSKNTKINWNRSTYELSVSNGNKKGGVACNLTFKSYPLLSEVEPGSYVAYTGNNGCSGKSCQGQNANYVSDTDMGYCGSPNSKYKVNGWRVGYISNGTAYLISAGSPQCVATPLTDSEMSSSVVTITLDSSSGYYYGSSYSMDASGDYSLSGAKQIIWSSANSSEIISNYPYTCRTTSSTGTCTTLYKVANYSSTTSATAYEIEPAPSNATNHISSLDSIALKYCNRNYAYGGVCNSSSSWALDDNDFKKITGSLLISPNEAVCFFKRGGDTLCGYNNSLIDNGSAYWYATAVPDSSSYGVVFWRPNGTFIYFSSPTNDYGLRPVIRLASSVYVTGGSGTYEDPYTIANG